jgi:4-hydroxybenzoate polyprenyltransferase
MVASPATRLGRFLRTAFDLGRLSESGLAMTCVVFGAATGADNIDARSVGRDDLSGVDALTLAVLIAVGIAYHGVAFCLNDIIDLPIDRTNPDRAHATLVSGRASVSAAWIAVCAFAATSFSLDLIRFHYATTPLVFLVVGYAGLIGYDMLTKRSGWPVLHDLLLALGCAALLCYAAERTGGLTSRALLAAAYVAIFVVLVNGVHGGLRDLHNDNRHGGLTTAAALGARIDEQGGLVLSRRLVGYTWTLDVAMASVAVAAVISTPARGGERLPLTVGVLLVTALGLAALGHALRHRRDPARFRRIGAAQILVSYAPVMLFTALDGGWRMGAAAVVVMIAPLPTNPRFRAAWRVSFLKLLGRIKTSRY